MKPTKARPGDVLERRGEHGEVVTTRSMWRRRPAGSGAEVSGGIDRGVHETRGPRSGAFAAGKSSGGADRQVGGGPGLRARKDDA